MLNWQSYPAQKNPLAVASANSSMPVINVPVIHTITSTSIWIYYEQLMVQMYVLKYKIAIVTLNVFSAFDFPISI